MVAADFLAEAESAFGSGSVGDKFMLRFFVEKGNFHDQNYDYEKRNEYT